MSLERFTHWFGLVVYFNSLENQSYFRCITKYRKVLFVSHWNIIATTAERIKEFKKCTACMQFSLYNSMVRGICMCNKTDLNRVEFIFQYLFIPF